MSVAVRDDLTRALVLPMQRAARRVETVDDDWAMPDVFWRRLAAAIEDFQVLDGRATRSEAERIAARVVAGVIYRHLAGWDVPRVARELRVSAATVGRDARLFRVASGDEAVKREALAALATFTGKVAGGRSWTCAGCSAREVSDELPRGWHQRVSDAALCAGCREAMVA